MCPAGFEPIISAGEWPQTYALDRAATGTGNEPGKFFNSKCEAELKVMLRLVLDAVRNRMSLALLVQYPTDRKEK